MSVSDSDVGDAGASLGQQNRPDLDPLLFGFLEGRLQCLDVHAGVENIVEALVILLCLEQCWDEDGSGTGREVHGEARVERMRDDDAIAFVAEGPSDAVDDSGYTSQNQDVLLSDWRVGAEVGAEK